MQLYINRLHTETPYLKHPPVVLLDIPVVLALKIDMFKLERSITP